MLMERIYEKCQEFKCQHAFSTRLGGVSKDEYESLNLGFNYGDSDENAIKNWNIFSKATKISIDNLIWSKQVHKNKVKILPRDFIPSQINVGMNGYDGLVTNNENLTLCIFTADCTPVLLCDRQAKVIGALHCGWKPLTADIVKNGIDAMKSLGTKAKNIQAVIGPCICKNCFEVGEEVLPHFTNLLGRKDAKKVIAKKSLNKYLINLRKSVELRLLQLGTSETNIFHVDECTSCHNKKYFSYRKNNGQTGRLASIIHL